MYSNLCYVYRNLCYVYLRFFVYYPSKDTCSSSLLPLFMVIVT